MLKVVFALLWLFTACLGLGFTFRECGGIEGLFTKTVDIQELRIDAVICLISFVFLVLYFVA